MTGTLRESNRRSIILIGFRGSGKSAVGRELAALIGGDYVDTDNLVAARSGKSIAQIFDEEGEGGFRRREREAIAAVVAQRPAVIGVGGGAILDAENVTVLRSVGVVVWLTAPADVLWQRISSDPDTDSTRPALSKCGGIDEVIHLLAEREPKYREAADLSIETSNSRPAEIAAEIARRCGIAPRNDR